MRHDYFEGVLQLRNLTQEMIDFVSNFISCAEGLKIAKIAKSENGVDFYLSSQKEMIKLGRRLQENFGGELNITRRIHTRSRVTSKDVYRVTVLFRLPNFKKGDVIKHRGRNLLILALGKKVFCRDADSNKKIRIPYREF